MITGILLLIVNLLLSVEREFLNVLEIKWDRQRIYEHQLPDQLDGEILKFNPKEMRRLLSVDAYITLLEKCRLFLLRIKSKSALISLPSVGSSVHLSRNFFDEDAMKCDFATYHGAWYR